MSDAAQKDDRYILDKYLRLVDTYADLIEENERLDAEVKQKTTWWQEYVHHYSVIEEEVDQLKAESTKLKTRIKFLEEKVADYKDRLKAALMKPQWDRKQK